MTSTPRSRLFATLCGLVLVGITSMCVGGAAAQDQARLESGHQQNHDYVPHESFESIDVVSGNLMLTFTDLVLPDTPTVSEEAYGEINAFGVGGSMAMSEGSRSFGVSYKGPSVGGYAASGTTTVTTVATSGLFCQ